MAGSSSKRIWEVVGGADKGGILVRAGREIASKQEAERLSTGALVLEVQLEGDRLCYERLTGSGPLTGWVSTRLKGKELLTPRGAPEADSQEEPELNVGRVRIWVTSDIHIERKENWAWIQGLDTREFANDVLILAGDVANSFSKIEAALRELRARFARIFFCTGNHDLWVSKSDGEDSMQRLRRILKLCDKLGIETTPGEVVAGARRVLVVPFQGWHNPQWDTEPDLDCWSGISDIEQTSSDYTLTVWPPRIRIGDGSAARAVDRVNDELFDMGKLLKRREGHEAVLSFSHYPPCLDVNPEKRYLIPPCLAKATGSTYLQNRVEQLKPDVHVFGHTHFGYDMEVDGIRYMQAPLATPMERLGASGLTLLGEFSETEPKPCLVWDSELPQGWVPRYKSAWTEYYTRYGRKPHATNVMPSVLIEASKLQPATSDCRAGWIKGRAPIWAFYPREFRVKDMAVELAGFRKRMEAGWTADGAARPTEIDCRKLVELMARKQCVVIDVRDDESSWPRIPGCISLAHPTRTEHLGELPDDELVDICERVNARGGGLVLYGEATAEECLEAAFYIAYLFRLWPRDIRILTGGFQAWFASGGEVEEE